MTSRIKFSSHPKVTEADRQNAHVVASTLKTMPRGTWISIDLSLPGVRVWKRVGDGLSIQVCEVVTMKVGD